MSRQKRQITDTDITRAVRSWTGDRMIAGDEAAGVSALVRAFVAEGAPLAEAARAAAVLHMDGVTTNDQWSGRLSGLGELGGTEGIKHHRAVMTGADRDVDVPVGKIYHAAISEARALRHARAH
jgi:hypothetical protein